MQPSNLLLLLIISLLVKIKQCEYETCSVDNKNQCSEHINLNRYILYDVNPPEGFNLRRDVYMRLAVFMHNLKQSKIANLRNFKLVLPPWSELYHWKSQEDNTHIPWSHFFDLKSLEAFAPIIEMHQFFNEIGSNYKQVSIDEVYILQNFDDMFQSENFEEKMKVSECIGNNKRISFYGYENLTSTNIQCLSFHGHASQLASILEKSNSKTILFHHAEIVLHNYYGDRLYWQARRSMRFNKSLRLAAEEYRKKYLNSTDKSDNTVLPDDWTKEKLKRNAKGGPYLCAHLRRRDFLWGRPTEVPDIESTAKQIEILLEKNKLKIVFIATDAQADEYRNLKALLSLKYKVFRYKPSGEALSKYKDGGIAIIDQIICSHAFYFVGTHESTFSFRIQEEREILGFPADRTFNRLCGNSGKCEKPSVWKIIH